MDNQAPEKKKKSLLVSVLVFVILIVLPLGTVYVSSSAVRYRKASLSEMEPKGMVGQFNIKNQNDIYISPDILKGRVTVVNFLSGIDSIAHFQANRIANVHKNYEDTDDVVFLSFVQGDSTKNQMNLATSLGITDHLQWYLLTTKNKDWNKFASNIFKIPDIENDVVLIDTSMTIRRFYDINSNPEMDRLVEQISIVVPKQKRRGM